MMRTYVEFDISSLKEKIKGREIDRAEFHSPDNLVLTLSDGETLTQRGHSMQRNEDLIERVKVIGVNPNLVVIRLKNGTIMRVGEDSFEFEHIPNRPRERKHIEYNDLLLANDFIKETHRLLPKPNYDLEGSLITLARVKLLIQRIYKPPILLYPHDIEAKDGC